MPLNHWGWIDSSAGGNVRIHVPAEAPLVTAPAAHGLQTPSAAAVNQRTGAAMMVIVAQPLAQVLTADATTSTFLNAGYFLSA
jgi:hypothetical protein